MTDATHAARMDGVYRYQRLFYDATRKFYLLGRDRLITGLNAKPGDSVLEIACGTGRNLQKIGRHYPGTQLFGLDISEQMLISARNKLGEKARLAQGDACNFDPNALWGQAAGFDHIVLSYCLSMIPDWEAAIAEAQRHLVPGGTVHIVDFGDQSGLPSWFKKALWRWLAKFHVTPRERLSTVLQEKTRNTEAHLNDTPLFRGYAHYATLKV